MCILYLSMNVAQQIQYHNLHTLNGTYFYENVVIVIMK
jgi:hypothetical protein